MKQINNIYRLWWTFMFFKNVFKTISLKFVTTNANESFLKEMIVFPMSQQFFFVVFFYSAYNTENR